MMLYSQTKCYSLDSNISFIPGMPQVQIPAPKTSHPDADSVILIEFSRQIIRQFFALRHDPFFTHPLQIIIH
jgi:hypothetical protein